MDHPSHSSGNQLTNFIIKPYFPSSVTVKRYHFEKLLDQITPQYLESFIRYIHENKCDPLCHSDKVVYCLREDVCILTILKLNQHKLCEEALSLIHLELTKIIPKSYKDIKQRHESLTYLDINHLLKAIQMDFDIVLGLELDSVNSWVQQWKKQHVLSRADIIVRRIENSAKFFVAVSNTRRSLNKVIDNKKQCQQFKLSKEDRKLIDKIYDQISKRKQNQINLFIENQQIGPQNMEARQKQGLINGNYRLKAKNDVEQGKEKAEEQILDDNQINKVKAKMRNLLKRCYLSPIINNKQTIHRSFSFIDNKTQRLRHTTLNLVFRKCKRMWQRIVSSSQQLDRLKDWNEILIQIVHTINRQNLQKTNQQVQDQSLVEIVMPSNKEQRQEIRITKEYAMKSTQQQIERIFEKVRLKRNKSNPWVIQI